MAVIWWNLHLLYGFHIVGSVSCRVTVERKHCLLLCQRFQYLLHCWQHHVSFNNTNMTHFWRFHSSNDYSKAPLCYVIRASSSSSSSFFFFWSHPWWNLARSSKARIYTYCGSHRAITGISLHSTPLEILQSFPTATHKSS